MNWLIYFLEAFVVGIIIGSLVLLFKKKYKNEIVRRWGGVIVIGTSLLIILVNPELEITGQIFSILVGGLAILVFGVLDDFKKISWKYQLVFQFALAAFFVLFGFNIGHIKLFDDVALNFNVLELNVLGNHFYLLATGAFILWAIIVVNSINWIDGIDGLSGTIFVMALLSIIFVSLRPEVNQPAIVIMSLIMIGATLAFLVFNFSFSSLIAGTSGSYFFGFILATLAVIAGMKIATLMLIVILPLIDAVWVVFDRIRNKQSVFVGDHRSRHLHYRLISIGWSEKKIVFVFGIFLACILGVNFCLQSRDFKLAFLILEFLTIILFMIYVHKKELSTKLSKND